MSSTPPVAPAAGVPVPVPVPDPIQALVLALAQAGVVLGQQGARSAFRLGDAAVVQAEDAGETQQRVDAKAKADAAALVKVLVQAQKRQAQEEARAQAQEEAHEGLKRTLRWFVDCFNLGEDHDGRTNYLLPPVDQVELNEWAMENPDIGVFCLVYLSQKTKSCVGDCFIMLLLFSVIIVQVTISSVLLYEQKKEHDIQWCPNRSDTWNTKILGFSIGLIYVSKLTFLFFNRISEINERGVMKLTGGGPIRAYVSMDRAMTLLFESLVYLLNLWVVYVTPKPLDMVLNALALEFVLRLDNDLKEIYLKAFPPNIEAYTAAWQGKPRGNESVWNSWIIFDLVVVFLTFLCLVVAYVGTFYMLVCKPDFLDIV
jgi:ABC-type glycerol-3-phosphate transport system permease component